MNDGNFADFERLGERMAAKSRKRDPNERTEDDHVGFMARPMDWPRWPFLPIKRYHQGQNAPECAYMVAQEGKLTTVFKASIYRANPETDEQVPYESYDAIVRDGWVVD